MLIFGGSCTLTIATFGTVLLADAGTQDTNATSKMLYYILLDKLMLPEKKYFSISISRNGSKVLKGSKVYFISVYGQYVVERFGNNLDVLKEKKRKMRGEMIHLMNWD